MYKISEITNVFIPEFDTVFESSYSHMEAGTFRWEDLGNFSSKEDKKQALQEKCQELINKGCKAIYWEEADLPLHIAIGYPELEGNLQYLHWIYAFLSENSKGSKSYIYSDDYIQATKKFFQEKLKLNGYKITCIKNQGVYLHHKTKTNFAYYSMSEKTLEEGFCELTFLYN